MISLNKFDGHLIFFRGEHKYKVVSFPLALFSLLSKANLHFRSYHDGQQTDVMINLAFPCTEEPDLYMTTSESRSRKETMHLKSKMKGNIHNTGNILAQVHTYYILVYLVKG